MDHMNTVHHTSAPQQQCQNAVMLITEFVDRLSWLYCNSKLYFFADKEVKLIIRMSTIFSNMRQSIS